MSTQDSIDFQRIATALKFIENNFKNQPSLDRIASEVHLSSYHFQRLFKRWAGTTPKKFLNYISISYAKRLLRERQANLFSASLDTGLSSAGRLHDLFIKIEGMTPAEYRDKGRGLEINYCYTNTLFGIALVATTGKGVCHLSFDNDKAKLLMDLKRDYPAAIYYHRTDKIQEKAIQFFSKDNHDISEIKLHLKATPFQIKVWEALLKIPPGRISTYGELALSIGNANAARAVGTAIGSNPVAYLIPCHRVIRASGLIGGYKWDTTRKTAMIGWEAALIND